MKRPRTIQIYLSLKYNARYERRWTCSPVSKNLVETIRVKLSISEER